MRKVAFILLFVFIYFFGNSQGFKYSILRFYDNKTLVSPSNYEVGLVCLRDSIPLVSDANGFLIINKTLGYYANLIVKYKENTYTIKDLAPNELNGLATISLFKSSNTPTITLPNKQLRYLQVIDSSGGTVYANIHESNDFSHEWTIDAMHGLGYKTLIFWNKNVGKSEYIIISCGFSSTYIWESWWPYNLNRINTTGNIDDWFMLNNWREYSNRSREDW